MNIILALKYINFKVTILDVKQAKKLFSDRNKSCYLNNKVF